jgi:hypothetical protein
VSDDALAPFSPATRAWFTGAFAAPYRGAAPGRPSPPASTRGGRSYGHVTAAFIPPDLKFAQATRSA